MATKKSARMKLALPKDFPEVSREAVDAALDHFDRHQKNWPVLDQVLAMGFFAYGYEIAMSKQAKQAKEKKARL